MTRRPTAPTSPAHRLALALLASAALLAAPGARAAEPYKLSPSELKLDCKRLTGTVKVRLIALRQKPSAPSSTLSRGVQSVATPIFGGTRHNADEATQRAADMSLVEAYNKRLAEKNCPSFDLAAALAAPGPASPSPTIPAKPKPDAKK